MKKLYALLLISALLLSGCSSKYRTDVTPDEIAAAYGEAGYSVWYDYYDEKLEDGQTGYIKAEYPDGDYIYFSIFETQEEAEAYKEEYYHPGAMGLFSAIFGDPSWQRWEVYGNIVVQYDNTDYFEPFEALLKST